MAKRKKQKNWLDVETLTKLGCTVRPVNLTDNWCRFQTNEGSVFYSIFSGEPQHGYVVIIPNVPTQNVILGKINGRIIRSKKQYGMLLLQVVKTCYSPEYGIKSFIREIDNPDCTDKTKQKRVINIRNISKSFGKW